MRLATLNTSATYAALRNNIMKVADYAKKVNGDVDQINAFVDLNYTQLKASGDTVTDSYTAIMKAYIASPDVKFSEYFSKKLDDYRNETPEMHNISVEALLKKAKSKFDLIRSQDEWGALSQEAQYIIALKSKVDVMSSVNLKLAKNLKDKAGGNQPGNGYPNTKGKKEVGKKNKNKKDNFNKRKQKEDETWMKKPPKDERASCSSHSSV